MLFLILTIIDLYINPLIQYYKIWGKMYTFTNTNTFNVMHSKTKMNTINVFIFITYKIYYNL